MSSQKCIIHRRVRIPKSMIDGNRVREDLIINDQTNNTFGKRDPLVTFKELSHNYIVPAQYGIKYIRKNNLPYEDRRPPGDKIDISFKGSLREAQIPVVDETMEALLEDHGATMNLYCGFGKTTCANMISCRLGLKTLILVHTSALAIQWKDRIMQFVEGASIGEIRRDTFDVENRTHVVALIQSIYTRDYGPNAFDSFGLMVVDEAHHICAKKFSKCVKIAGAKYRLGLSATPTRKDGYTPYLFNSIGAISSAVGRKMDTQELSVNTIWITDGPTKIHNMNRFGKKTIIMARMVNDLCSGPESEPRTDCIVKCLLKLAKEGRHIIVLSDRRQHIISITDRLDEQGFSDYGFMVGGIKEAGLKIAEKKTIILATYAFCSEGVDVPSLDTVVFTTPRSDVIQCVGRILRVHPMKKTPLVVDFVDDPYVFRNQYKKRKTYYGTLGGKIYNMDQDLTLKKQMKRKIEKVEEVAVQPDAGMFKNFFKKMN